MKKYYLSFLVCVFAIGNAYADVAMPKELSKWVNPTTIAVVVGGIVLLVIGRKIVESRKKSQNINVQQNKHLHKDDILNPRFWYQCKKCKVTIKKDSPPNTADCFKAVDHLWTQLGEVGPNKYFCRNCSTLVETKAVPAIENCPDFQLHDWELLP
jgi:hypothetical protein